MNIGYVPKLSMLNEVDRTFQANLAGYARHVEMLPQTDETGATFKSVMGNLVNNVNSTLGAPDALMKEAMTTGSVDVHDVMIANAKAELAVNVTTQVATKVIQAYDRILQIQI